MKQLRLMLRPHVRQYLLKEYGPEPINIRHQHPLGRIIVLATEKQPYSILRRRAQKQQSYEQLNLAPLCITLPTSLHYGKLSEKSLKDIAYVLESKFNDGLCLWIKGRISMGDRVWPAIQSFYAYYDIDEGLYERESARKVWRDYTYRALRDKSIPPDPKQVLLKP